MSRKKSELAPRQAAKKRAEREDMIRKIDEAYQQRRAKYRGAVDSWRHLQPVPRAESWLDYWVQSPEAWSDQEALVYAVSRNRDCKKAIKELISTWRAAEAHSFENLAARHPDSRGRAREVADYSGFELRNFWEYADDEELTIDATMLRTAHWCGAEGFDGWWKRLATEVMEGAFNGGIHWFALFALCRSDYALEHMHSALLRTVEALEVSTSRTTPPWRVTSGNLGCAIHQAACIAFASTQLAGKGEPSPLVKRALDDIRRHFNHEVGAWPAFGAEPLKFSTESTALALHALRSAAVSDFELFARPASAWLVGQQHPDGYWTDPGSPGPVWLTVLVLDALAITSGSTNLTFRVQAQVAKSRSFPKVFLSYRRDDTRYPADRLYRAFMNVLPPDHVFMDINSIPLGQDFRTVLRGWVDQCDVLLALIGPGWASARDPKRKYRRLDSEDDLVRIEIAEALARGIPVVPVLIDTPMPDPAHLPENLKELTARQAEFVQYRTFEEDVARLIRRLGVGPVK